VGLLALAIPMIILANRGPGGRASEAYYSDDDGKTWFEDDIDKLYPFDRNGKQAYRAYVYQCGSKEPFVAYLARYTDAAKSRITELGRKTGDPEAESQAANLRSNAIEVKRPGETEWVGLFTAEGGAIASHPSCPDGGEVRALSP